MLDSDRNDQAYNQTPLKWFVNNDADPAKIERECHHAFQLHQEGQNQKAKELCKRVLTKNPKHSDALHLLGLIAHRSGCHDEAVALIIKAIKHCPGVSTYYGCLGDVLAQKDQLSQALACYQKALKLRPDYAEAYFGKANALKNQGRFKEAIGCYQKAIEITPNYAEAFNNLGNALKFQNKLDEALSCYRRAIQIHHTYPEAYYNWANILKIKGDIEAAIEKYYTAIRIRPDFVKAYCNLGTALTALGNFDGAIKIYQQAIRLKPNLAEPHNNLGNVYNETYQFDSAIRHFQKAIAIKKDYAEAFNNLGVAHYYRGQTQEALASYDQAIRLKPDFADARWNRSLVLLQDGNLKEGFREYEWRFCKSNWKVIYPYRYKIPRWDGSRLNGRRLYVHDEQGLGDALQFIRYLTFIKDQDGEIILEVKKPLHCLIKNFPGIDQLVERSADQKPSVPCDLNIPLLSLPAVFGTTLKTIPANVPYLFPDPQKGAYWNQRLSKDTFKVGIVWSGRPVQRNEPLGLRYRSCEFKAFAPLAEISNLTWYGLQKGEAAKQVAQLPAFKGMINLGEEFKDFSDTAAAIENLDLVIAVDTSVAHLAGALAKPVWLLLSSIADWRWLTNRVDSPWYPTMRIFRQKNPGDWDTVIEKVACQLRLLLAARS